MANSQHPSTPSPMPVDPATPTLAAADSPPPPQQQAPAKPDAQWTCVASRLEANGSPGGELKESITVGQKFHLACAGERIELKKESLGLELPAEAKYDLRILEVRSLSDSRAEMIATAWTAGEIKLENPVLSDGEKRLGLGPIEFKVDTVIDQKANPEMKPAPPWSVMTLGVPAYVWGVIGGLLLLALVLSWLALRRTIRRRRLLKLLEKNPIVTTPYNQFNKDLRQLNRKLPLKTSDWKVEDARRYFAQLNESFRWYLARSLVLPAIGTRPGEILGDLKKIDPNLQKRIRRDLGLALTELRKASESSSVPALEDATQLAELCRKLADQIAERDASEKGRAR